MYRDSQRQRVYNAEHEAFEETPHNRLMDFKEAEDFTYMIAPLWIKFKVSKRMRPGRAHHDPNTDELVFSEKSLRSWVIIHEATHAWEDRGAAHGPEFARKYIEMVRHYLGSDAEKLLLNAFDKHKVDYEGRSKPSKPSPKKKCELREKAKAAGYNLTWQSEFRQWWLTKPGESVSRYYYNRNEVEYFLSQAKE